MNPKRAPIASGTHDANRCFLFTQTSLHDCCLLDGYVRVHASARMLRDVIVLCSKILDQVSWTSARSIFGTSRRVRFRQMAAFKHFTGSPVVCRLNWRTNTITLWRFIVCENQLCSLSIFRNSAAEFNYFLSKNLLSRRKVVALSSNPEPCLCLITWLSVVLGNTRSAATLKHVPFFATQRLSAFFLRRQHITNPSIGGRLRRATEGVHPHQIKLVMRERTVRYGGSKDDKNNFRPRLMWSPLR